ncbi:hypothetical protein ACE3MS_02505 [Paenibacillus dendritiformis]
MKSGKDGAAENPKNSSFNRSEPMAMIRPGAPMRSRSKTPFKV